MKLLVTICVLVQVLLVTSRELRTLFPEPCHRSDPELTECFTEYLDKLGKLLVEGAPEYNIPKFDPLEIDLITVNSTLDDNINVELILKKFHIGGLGKYFIKVMKFDPESLLGEVCIINPTVIIDLDFDATVRIGNAAPQARGNFRALFTELTTYVDFTLKEVQRKEKKHFVTNKLKVNGNIGNGTIQLISKNPDTQRLADILSTFFNSNQKQVLDTLNPLYVAILNEVASFSFKRTLGVMPEEQLLVD